MAKRRLLTVVVVIAALWIAASGTLYALMCRPPEQFARAMAKMPAPVAFLLLPFETLWTHARNGHLQVGDTAPDFKLMKLDHNGDVQLSTWTSRGRPVVLVFGSFT